MDYTVALIRDTLRRWCYECRAERDIKLPPHPAGLGKCLTCGTSLDLADYRSNLQREYFACYRREDATHDGD